MANRAGFQATRPGVGAVGCRLYYPDDHVQHDGIIVGMGGVAGYAQKRIQERRQRGIWQKYNCSQLAATAAALAIRKSVMMIGGLDEENLQLFSTM